MYKRERQGTCSFTYIELFDDVEKAANPKEKGKFVECKVSDVRFDFTKVKKEKDGKAKTEFPRATGSSEGET
jgi:hypothetical protein